MNHRGVTPSAGDPVLVELLDRCTFPAGGVHVDCAVSGGADSTALLALALAAGLQVTAVYVDHGLRPGSGDEADHVGRLARSWGAGFQSRSAPVRPGPNLEARARAARHAALPPESLLGHTADDQAETVLLRLIRGTGPAGLAAMRPDRHPILGLRRSETAMLCAHLGVKVVDDASNNDPRFRRNRVRHELLPLLDDVAGRDVVPLLGRLAALSADQADLLAALSAGVDPTDAASLASAPTPVASEAVRRWWRHSTGGELPPDAAAIGRIMAVAAGGPSGCDVALGWSVRRRQGRLSLIRPCGAPVGRE